MTNTTSRRDSSIMFVRRFSLSPTIERIRSLSEPNVSNHKIGSTENKSKNLKLSSSGKSTPGYRKKQKNCVIS